jgi:hypothetical protein
MGEISKLYRVESTYVEGGGTKVYIEAYKVASKTKCGVWIYVGSKQRFVNLELTKKFAYPTKEEAISGFIARKKRQIQILRGQLDLAEESIDIVKSSNIDEFKEYGPYLQFIKQE